MYVADIVRTDTMIVTLSDGSTVEYGKPDRFRNIIINGDRHYLSSIHNLFHPFKIFEPWGGMSKDLDTYDDDQLSKLSVVLITMHKRFLSMKRELEYDENYVYVVGEYVSDRYPDFTDDIVITINTGDKSMYINIDDHYNNIVHAYGDDICWGVRYDNFTSLAYRWNEYIPKMLAGKKRQYLPRLYAEIKEIEDMYNMGITDTKSAKC
jgi:hypothetical protein